MIFPEKTVSVKLREIIQNGIAIVIAIGTLMWAFVTGEIWTPKVQTLLIGSAVSSANPTPPSTSPRRDTPV